MSDSTYQLQVSDTLLPHWSQASRLLHDHSGDASDMDIEALVASGDCLITLATSLDSSTQLLASDPEAVRPQVEKVIRTLLYLQRRYKLVRKPAEHRQ